MGCWVARIHSGINADKQGVSDEEGFKRIACTIDVCSFIFVAYEIIIKRKSVGSILSMDKDGFLMGVRCYHENNDGQDVRCRCIHKGDDWELCPEDLLMQKEGTLFVDDSVLQHQRLQMQIQSNLGFTSCVNSFGWGGVQVW